MSDAPIPPVVPTAVAVTSTRARRQAFEQRQRRRSFSIAAGSMAVVLGLTVWLVPKTEGWEKVRQSFFSWPDFKDAIARIWRPFLYDVQIFLVCVPLILVAGMLVASARSVRAPALFPLRFGARLYTDIVRGVPVILWITLIGFGIPGLLQTREWYTRPVVLGAATLVMVYSAYVSEVLRAGIESVHESQRAAARSLGMSSGQTMRAVVLPQAVRRVVPALMNDFVSLQKDVALISLLGPVEALRRATTIQQRTFNFTPYVAAAVLFLCVSVPLTRFTDYLLAKQRKEMSGTAVR